MLPENGKQAFEKVRELKLDLVILNVSMRVMNSVEAAREIRWFAPGSKIASALAKSDPPMLS